MPKREDERYLSEKQGLRYCSAHAKYYQNDKGCPFCQSDKLLYCPWCGKKSWLWNKHDSTFECLNSECQSSFRIK